MRHRLLLPLTVLLLAPATASAFTLQTTITSPASGTRVVSLPGAHPIVHIAGTANVAAVDILCVSSSAGSGTLATTPIATNVAVAADDSFGTDVAWTQSGVCELFAWPTGDPPPATNTDLNGFSGATVYSATTFEYSTAGKVFDFDTDLTSSKGYYDVESLGDFPMDFQQLLNMHEYDGTPGDGGAELGSQDPTSSTPAPSLAIDGRPAYATATIGYSSTLKSLPGWTALTYSVTDDAGTFHSISHEDTFHCSGGSAPDAFPPTGASCGGFAGTGVGATVDERQPGDGRTLIQNITYTSTDHQAHTISAVMQHFTNVAREWQFPGTAFQSYANGTSPSVVAAGPATIRNREPGSPDPDITKGFAAITYVRQPSAEIFTTASDAFAQRYPAITIPADGSIRFEFIYTEDAGSSGLDALVAAAEASIGAPPAVTATSPATASSAGYTLTGTVNAPERLNAFTVNGQAVSVGGDGSFSMPATLASGANAFTLAATDELGRTTTTPFTVTLSSSPPPAGVPLAVRFAISGKLKVKGRSVATGVTASCPGAGPSCSVAARSTAGRKVAGRGSATIAAGATAKLKVTLTKAAAKLLKRKHRLKLALTLTGKRTGAATTTLKRTLKLKLKA